MANSNSATVLISAGQASRLLGVTHERLRQLARNGWFPTAVKGKYPLVPIVQGYIRFLQGDDRRAARSKADSALKSARRREIEVRIAEREARLIDLEDVDAVAMHMAWIFRKELAPVPTEATPDPAMQRTIADLLSATIARYERRWAEARAVIAAGRDPFCPANDTA